MNGNNGLRIKNIEACFLYEVNLGVRDYFNYTNAMLTNSLFLNFLKGTGMLNIHKGSSTKDVICINFNFGSKGYKDQIDQATKRLSTCKTQEEKQKCQIAIEKIENNKSKYKEISKENLRTLFYNNGIDITYILKNKDGNIKESETIHYKKLYRTPSKAKAGSVIFINSKLYELAYKWLTMGLWEKMKPKSCLSNRDAKIVEMSAYAPLTTSTIINTLHIPVKDILILNDKDSSFSTVANIVKAEDIIDEKTNKPTGKNKCIVKQMTTDVVNTIWDGMGIIETSILPKYINGMALLRNHFFKMCGFKGKIQQFYKDYCKENGLDYNTYKVFDMFGNEHYVKDIKVITTNNAIKWVKFRKSCALSDLEMYDYWCNKVKADGEIWGIVKTDHESKLGEVQQMSYQMINSLPTTKPEIHELAKESIDYVTKLKNDDNEFIQYLKDRQNISNCYDMLITMYEKIPRFKETRFYKRKKYSIISAYIQFLKQGKIIINADNLTLCGNPYELLEYSITGELNEHTTFKQEKDCVQCYTTRFNDNEYLGGFRNPHNSPNNIVYFHNVLCDKITKYFEFSKNIIAVNNIHTDIQSRLNGCDYDSDFVFVTNNPTIVNSSKRAYKHFPTIVNALKESGVTYNYSPTDYADMDNKFSHSQLGIGWSSNLAQLALTYYWTEQQKPNKNNYHLTLLQDNFIILSVIAQVIIDGCKREYEIDGMEEIKRIAKMPCMKHTVSYMDNDDNIKQYRRDYPSFMRYIKKIERQKNGKPIDNAKVEEDIINLKNRIDYNLICPMNWLEEELETIPRMKKTSAIENSEIIKHQNGKVEYKQLNKIQNTIIDCEKEIQSLLISINNNDINKSVATNMVQTLYDGMIKKLNRTSITNTIIYNRLIEQYFNAIIYQHKKLKSEHIEQFYGTKILTTLFRMNKRKFLSNFKIE